MILCCEASRARKREENIKIDLLTTFVNGRKAGAVMCGKWCQTYWLGFWELIKLSLRQIIQLLRSQTVACYELVVGPSFLSLRNVLYNVSCVYHKNLSTRGAKNAKNYCESFKIISSASARWLTICIHLRLPKSPKCVIKAYFLPFSSSLDSIQCALLN